MKIKRPIEIIVALVIGISLAWAVSYALGAATEAPEMQRCGTGQPLFFRPLPEDVAKDIAEACRAKIDREGVIRRFENAHSWPVNFGARLIDFLIDPINLVMAIVFTVLAAWALASISRRRGNCVVL